MVPLKEMVSVLSVNKKKITLQKDSFVRIKRGLYKGNFASKIIPYCLGDIACVFDQDEGSFVYCLIVPRLDMQKLREPPAKDDDDDEEEEDDDLPVFSNQRRPRRKRGKKRKRTPEGPRPPARLFKANEIYNILGQYADIQSERDPISGEPVQKFNGHMFKNGLLYKKV